MKIRLATLLVFAVCILFCTVSCTSSRFGKQEEPLKELSTEEIEKMSVEELRAYLKKKEEQDKFEARKDFLGNYKKKKAEERASKLDVSSSYLENDEPSGVFPWKKDSGNKSETLRDRGSIFYDW